MVLDGNTIDADQRLVREILKDPDLERANHTATLQEAMNAKERVHVHRVSVKQNDWDDVGDRDDKNRVQMTNDKRDDVNDSRAGTSDDITKDRARVARISYLSQGRPHLKFASMQVFFARANPSVHDMERVKRIGRYLVGKLRAECLFHWQREIHSTIGVSWSDHEKWTFSEGVDQEAAGGVAVHRRK